MAKQTLRDICRDFCEDAGGNIAEIDVFDVLDAEADDTIMLDCRQPQERVDEGVIPDDRHAVLDTITQTVEDAVFGRKATDEDLERPIICYCRSGRRSLAAADALKKMGFTTVLSLRGGINAWKGAGGPTG